MKMNIETRFGPITVSDSKKSPERVGRGEFTMTFDKDPDVWMWGIDFGHLVDKVLVRRAANGWIYVVREDAKQARVFWIEAVPSSRADEGWRVYGQDHELVGYASTRWAFSAYLGGAPLSSPWGTFRAA